MDQSQYTKKTIVVCLSSSPSGQRMIKAAKKLHNEGDQFIAIYVNSKPDIQNDSQLAANIELVKRLGGTVEIIESDDLLSSIVEYAKRVGATDLFVGYSAPSNRIFAKKPFTDELSSYLPNTDIHIIPSAISSAYPKFLKAHNKLSFQLNDLLIVIIIMTIATLLSFWFYQSRYSNANIITIYILAVLISSILTSHQVYGIIAAGLYILLFNFLFIEPRFTLLVYDSAYLVTYLISFFAAFITGSLASKLKNIATQSAENAYRAKVLLETSNQLERAHDHNTLIQIVCSQLSLLLDRPIYYFELEEDEVRNVYACDVDEIALLNDEEIDKEIIRYTSKQRHHAGAFTKKYADCPYRYYSIHNDHSSFGVIGIDMKGRKLNDFERTILLSILNEFALVLENEAIAVEKQDALIRSENANFRSSLLRSISHDLRTPLTAIYGNAENLSNNANIISEADKQKMYQDIKDDSLWLKSQMENILAMTKVENDEYLNITVESVEDLILEAKKHIDDLNGHQLVIEEIPESLYVKADMKLIELVLVNLINNAIKYTPASSTITVEAHEEGPKVWISIKDDGEGISKEDQEHIFELFYTGKKTIEDSYRSMGIGLNYCLLAIQAHHQEIEVLDNQPKGTIFRFSLEKEEIPYE